MKWNSTGCDKDFEFDPLQKKFYKDFEPQCKELWDVKSEIHRETSLDAIKVHT